MVGAFCDLRPDDAIAAHYRDPLVIYMMRGAEMARLVAQVLGKVGGYNKGRSVPFTGPVDLKIVPWVAGDLGTSLGVATGAALAFQQEGSDRVCVCTFGDGTANRGDFHENRTSRQAGSCPSSTSASTTAGLSPNPRRTICRPRSPTARRDTAYPASNWTAMTWTPCVER